MGTNFTEKRSKVQLLSKSGEIKQLKGKCNEIKNKETNQQAENQVMIPFGSLQDCTRSFFWL